MPRLYTRWTERARRRRGGGNGSGSFAQRGAGEQPGRVERGERRARVVEDQRQLGAAEHHRVAAVGREPGDDALERSARCRTDHAVDQLVHDDAIDVVALRRRWADGGDAARGELLGVDLAVDEPARAEDAEP